MRSWLRRVRAFFSLSLLDLFGVVVAVAVAEGLGDSED